MLRSPRDVDAESHSATQVVREQFDAFERQERLIRTEERLERAIRFRLPIEVYAVLTTSGASS